MTQQILVTQHILMDEQNLITQEFLMEQYISKVYLMVGVNEIY
jgi:hypothetical protein